MSAMNQDSLSALLRSGSCIMLHIRTYTLLLVFGIIEKKGKAEFPGRYCSYQLIEQNLLPVAGSITGRSRLVSAQQDGQAEVS